ncbi:2-isopropylmalate synthase [Leptospira sp. GIMC2001]|uniref:2-isopropylmalate synthase n=1 Tax=Leptospira sp. GIMC2001 TaxID=1513297 RepID=UPI00234B0742|nr:2-isopropylmalate synthase [Leptospira sp. GIMC2001]WCL50027.1 2-isopropylmalate synthase [Leptospira sp. GIMC2001]
MKYFNKYKPFPKFKFPERTWPNKTLVNPPIWCSVDLRDGNQALVQPMNIQEKLEFFHHLVGLGFKEIEVGYPAASDTEFEFLRELIEGDYIPDDVTIQVLTQSREDLIRRTFEGLKGAKKAILHFYNSTSPVQRQVVFGQNKSEIIALGVRAAELIQEIRMTKEFQDQNGKSRIRIEYSPESFSSTEPEYALEICQAVSKVFAPTIEDKMIINLPATVEVYTPNVYADIVEWFGKNFHNRDSIIISLHTHNDRGTGIAASELGLLAGADRIEGTLLGNGERTGNADLVTLALNFYSMGIDPHLDFSNINKTIQIFEKCNKIRVPERHPYAGELVFTAFSGSHQDAIHKGFQARNEREISDLEKSDKDQNTKKEIDINNLPWEIPYLPIDPKDLGRDYTSVVRINSQSGKGGVSFILEKDFGISLSKEEKKIFGQVVKDYSDSQGREVNTWELKRLWEKYNEELNAAGSLSSSIK